jgi:hypothetical protein
MIVQEALKVEGCLEGSNVYDLKLVGEVERGLIDHLGKMGKLTYREDYEKPFFRIIVRGKCSFKGVEGTDEIRVILPDNCDFDPVQDIIDQIKLY